VVAGAAAAVTAVSPTAWSCPFCTAQALTLGQEIGAADTALLARLVSGPKSTLVKPGTDQAGGEIEKSKFEVFQVLKGEKHLSGAKTVEAVYFGQAAAGSIFLLVGFDAPRLNWSSPIALTERSAKYVSEVLKLPEKGVDRIAFFQDYLEDKEDLLARDAYDEFARTPFSVVAELRPRMKHDRIVEWIKNPEVPTSRRRLYLTLLSVCGGKEDLPMLEGMLKASDRQSKAALDALVSCYMMLKGPEAMPLIDELFMNNPKADYADTYSAIMAIRFQGEEGKAVPRQRLLVSLRHVLKRPQLADMVIPDLARWEDWSVMDELVALFEKSDNDSSWVRVPIVNYFRACPKPEAQDCLKRLAKIDPDTVNRASTLFPFAGAQPAPPTADDKKARDAKKAEEPNKSSDGQRSKQEGAAAPPGSSSKASGEGESGRPGTKQPQGADFRAAPRAASAAALPPWLPIAAGGAFAALWLVRRRLAGKR
jgi:hypothetical protein